MKMKLGAESARHFLAWARQDGDHDIADDVPESLLAKYEADCASLPTPADQTLHGVATILVMSTEPTGYDKPFLRVTFEASGTVLYMTTNLAEMIGGAAKGLRERHEAGEFHD